MKPIPTHEKIFVVGKSGPNATFSLNFLGLGWSWVGEVVGFIIIFVCFLTQQDLVYRKQPQHVSRLLPHAGALYTSLNHCKLSSIRCRIRLGVRRVYIAHLGQMNDSRLMI